MLHSYSVKKRNVFLSYFLLLLCTIYFSVANAQTSKPPRAVKSNWQTRLKRVYLFTDINDQENNNMKYTSKGEFSIHRLTDNGVIFKGQDIYKTDTSVTLASRSFYIIDPLGSSKAEKTDSVYAVSPELDVPIKDFSVFPNPIDNSQREITLDLNEFDSDKELKVSLFDPNGLVISQQSFKPQDKQRAVSIPQLSPGFYYIKVYEENQQYSKKLMVR